MEYFRIFRSNRMNKQIYRIEGICLRIPVVVGENGIERMIKIPLNEEELGKLQQSASTLKEALKDI